VLLRRTERSPVPQIIEPVGSAVVRPLPDLVGSVFKVLQNVLGLVNCFWDIHLTKFFQCVLAFLIYVFYRLLNLGLNRLIWRGLPALGLASLPGIFGELKADA